MTDALTGVMTGGGSHSLKVSVDVAPQVEAAIKKAKAAANEAHIAPEP